MTFKDFTKEQNLKGNKKVSVIIDKNGRPYLTSFGTIASELKKYSDLEYTESHIGSTSGRLIVSLNIEER